VLVAVALCDTLKHAHVVVLPQQVLARTTTSWPSGHAAAVAALAGSMTLTPRPVLLRCAVIVAAVALMTVACVSLLTTAAHTPFDLLGGAAIGGVSFSAVAPWMRG
jgi:membrane-associated phospholipid phosphatase